MKIADDAASRLRSKTTVGLDYEVMPGISEVFVIAHGFFSLGSGGNEDWEIRGLNIFIESSKSYSIVFK